jgi:hypothetical protein
MEQAEWYSAVQRFQPPRECRMTDPRLWLPKHKERASRSMMRFLIRLGPPPDIFPQSPA